MNFVHFDIRAPKVAFGKDLLAYISDIDSYVSRCNSKLSEEMEKITIRDGYMMLRRVWRDHRPPEGVKGIYTFINIPCCINTSLIPGVVYDTALYEAYRSFWMRDFKNDSDRWEAAYQKLLNNNEKLITAFHYELQQVKRIFAHKTNQHGWVKMTPAEILKLSPEELSNIYECFIELK